MEEIVQLLRRYEKARLNFQNSKERDMPTVERDRMSMDSALLVLEHAIDSYIDKRVHLALERMYR